GGLGSTNRGKMVQHDATELDDVRAVDADVSRRAGEPVLARPPQHAEQRGKPHDEDQSLHGPRLGGDVDQDADPLEPSAVAAARNAGRSPPPCNSSWAPLT